MNRLSALTLLLATLSAASLHAADAQRQQLNRGLRALPLEDVERKLASENAQIAGGNSSNQGNNGNGNGNGNGSDNGNQGNNGNGNGNGSEDTEDTVAATAGPTTTTIAPSSGATAGGSDDVSVSPSDASSTETPTQDASTETPTQDASTETPTQDASTETPTQDASTETPTQDASTETPTQDASTANPTQDASTANPTDENSTVSPTEEDSTITPSTAIPSTPVRDVEITIAPSESLIITEVPTEGDDLDTSAPTEVPTADMTLSPTEAEEDSEVESDCQDNPNKYDVMVDLQIEFEEQVVIECTSAEEKAIAVAISEAMNQAFPERVPDWEGAAEFAAFEFDDQQTYDDISEVAGSRQLRGRMLEAAKRLASKRRRADVFTCPLRGDLTCPNGYCMWGCVQADTTLCGDDASTDDWVDMGEDIKASLIALATFNDGGYECLGQLKHFDVLVTLEEGTMSAPSAAPSEELIVRGNFVTDAPTPTPRVFEDKGEEIPINTKLFLSYFKNKGGDLENHHEVELQLMAELAKFIEALISSIEEYKNFNGMSEKSLTHSWDEESRELTLSFSTNIWFTELDEETDHSLARLITSKGDFHKFIKQLREHKCEQHVDQAECEQWMTGIHSVRFQGTGTGRRLEMVEAVEEELA